MDMIYVGPLFRNYVAGGEWHIFKVLQYLGEAGMEVKVLRGSHAGIFNDFLLDNLLDYYRLTKMVDSKREVLLEPYARRFSLVLFNRLVRTTMEYTIVGMVNALYFSHRQSAAKNTIDRWVSRLFFSSLDMIIAGGRAAAGELFTMGVPPENIRVVYPALRREFEKVHRIQKDIELPARLLVVGRVDPIKGLESLFEAVRIADQQYPIHVTVVGDHDRYPRYTAKLADQVKALGLEGQVDLAGLVRDVQRLMGFYEKADIFVLPSLWETSPVSLLEAMCFGLPIVASNVGGISEYLGDGGILVPPGDAGALAQAILTLIEDQDIRKQVSQKSFERSHQFRSRTWEDVGREYYEIFVELEKQKTRSAGEGR